MCPSGGEHAGEEPDLSLVRNESAPTTHQSGLRRCTECAVLFAGTQSRCPKTGDVHSRDEDSKYILRKGGPWNRCGQCKALFRGVNSRCPKTGDVHVSDGFTFTVDHST